MAATGGAVHSRRGRTVVRGPGGDARFLADGRGIRDARQPAAAAAGPAKARELEPAGDPDQVRLAGYLDAAEALLRPRLDQLSGPLALRLDVGLPGSAALLNQRDLDNYLLPLAARLGRAGTSTLACVWGTKQHAGTSLIRIERVAPAATAPPSGSRYTVRTSAPGQSTAFKEQIRERLSGASQIPPGPVRMQLCFTVGQARNWLNLWKPAIDAMGQILGNAPAARPWSPLDGRIVDLGLHCRVNPSIGHDVIIAIAATHA